MIVNTKQMSKRDAPVPAHVLAIAEAQRQRWAAQQEACQARKDELQAQAEVLAPTVFEPVVRRTRRLGRRRLQS